MLWLSVILISFSLLSLQVDANCNLLAEDGSNRPRYIDSESESSLLRMCKKKSESPSLWEKYQCEYNENRYGIKTCWAQRRMSHCEPGNLLGVIVLYPGFSACPNYYNEIAKLLQAKCWHVYQPGIVGHGYNYCLYDTSCSAGKYNLTKLPMSRQGYVDYVSTMIDIINDEVSIVKQCELKANSLYDVNNLQVAVGGLSFGANLAAATVLLSGPNSVFTKQLLMSPSILSDIGVLVGVSWWDQNFKIYGCFLDKSKHKHQSIWQCLSQYLSDYDSNNNNNNNNNIMKFSLSQTLTQIGADAVSSAYPPFLMLGPLLADWVTQSSTAADIELIQDFLNSEMLWDEYDVDGGCHFDVLYRDRGGFCQFHVRQMVAVIAFNRYVMQLLVDNVTIDDGVETLWISSERDGQFANGFSADYLRLFYGSDDVLREKSRNCMWLVADECKVDTFSGGIESDCGVPHAFISVVGNVGFNPYYLYWKEIAYNGITAWLNNDGSKGKDFMVSGLQNWDGSRHQCVELDLLHPPQTLLYTNNNIRDTLNKIVNIDVDKLLGIHSINGINKINKIVINSIDISVNILTLLKVIQLQLQNDAYDIDDIEDEHTKDCVANNYKVSDWLWKLFDIKLNSDSERKKLITFTNTFTEISYLYHKCFDVDMDIDSMTDLSKFFNVILDELLDDNGNEYHLNDIKGLAQQITKIVFRIQEFNDLNEKQKKEKVLFIGDAGTGNYDEEKHLIVIALISLNFISSISFIICCFLQQRKNQCQTENDD